MCLSEFVLIIHYVNSIVTGHNVDLFGVRVVVLVLRIGLCTTFSLCSSFVISGAWIKDIILMDCVTLAQDMIK